MSNSAFSGPHVIRVAGPLTALLLRVLYVILIPSLLITLQVLSHHCEVTADELGTRVLLVQVRGR